MAETANLYLGGVPCMATGPVGWTQTVGAAPPFQTFEIHEKSWSIIESQMGDFVELSGAIEWDRLLLVREAPTSTPFYRAVVVSDVRYLWAREIVVRSMNIPRKTGDKRMVGGELVELKEVVDTYKYARASLNPNGKRWTPREAVESVLAELAQKCGHTYFIESMPVKEERELTVEGLEFADPGDTALNRVLSHIPHALVTVDSDGTARVFDGTDFDVSDEAMDEAGPATDRGQVDREINLDAIRPSSIHVYFTKEVELRFDSAVEAEYDGGGSSDDSESTSDAALMDNVLPLPDPQTNIPGKKGNPYAQGTYVKVSEALAAWNQDLAAIGKAKAPPQLNLANLRRHWWVLESLYAPVGNLVPSASQANWAARIATLRNHYRQTFRIRPRWMEHIRDLVPFRVGILDPVSGARCPALAWSQYCIEPTMKCHTLADIADDDDFQFYWVNVDTYPGFDGQLWSKTPAPARVEVVDRDLGILHINYQSDRFQMRSQIHPSMMRDNGSGPIVAPTRDYARALNYALFRDAKVKGTGRELPLADDFRVAIVVTAMPFAPNHEGRLLKWDVNPGDITPFLSKRFKVDGGSGRPWHIFIPPTLMTAWYAHQITASARESAKRLFGLVATPPDEDNDNAAGYSVMNSDAMIPSMARAAALAQWAEFVNQREGTRAIHLLPDVRVQGAIESVRHSIAPDGRRITEVSLPSARRVMSPLAFIPYEMRPKILGQIPNIKP